MTHCVISYIFLLHVMQVRLKKHLLRMLRTSMPKGTEHQKFTGYKDSPLYLAIENYKKQLEAIQKKYSDVFSKTESTIDEHHAVSQFSTIMDMVDKAMYVMSFFDKGALPGNGSYLQILISIKDLLHFRNYFKMKEGIVFQIVKKHLEALAVFDGPEALKQLKKGLEDDYDKLNELTLRLPGQDLKQIITGLTQHIDSFDLTGCMKDGRICVQTFKTKMKAQIKEHLLSNLDEHGLLITHEIIYEAALHLLNLVHSLPDTTLAEVAPFFNPKALNVDYTWGFSGAAVNVYIKGGFKFEHIDAENKTSNYSYWVTLKGERFPMDFDAQYKHQKQKISKQLLTQFQRYITRYAETDSVKTLQARLATSYKLVSDIDTKLALITEPLDSYHKAVLEIEAVDVFGVSKKLEACKKAFNDFVDAENKINQLQSLLLDESFKAIPDFFVGSLPKQNDIQWFELKKPLIDKIHLQHEGVIKSMQNLQIVKNDLLEKYKYLLSQWKQNNQQNIKNKLKSFYKEFRSLEEKIKEISVETHGFILNTDNYNYTDSVKYLNLGLNQLIEHKQQIHLLGEAINQLFLLPDPDLDGHDHAEFMRQIKAAEAEELKRVTSIANSLDHTIAKLKHDIEQLHQSVSQILEDERIIKKVSESGLSRVDDLIVQLNSQGVVDDEQLKQHQAYIHSYQLKSSELKAQLQHIESILTYLSNKKITLQQERKEQIATLVKAGKQIEDPSDFLRASNIEVLLGDRITVIGKVIEQLSSTCKQVDYVQIISILTKVKEALISNQEQGIPVDAINKIPELNDHQHKNKGLNYLLELLGQSGQISRWSSFIKRQSYARKEETQELRATLLDSINNREKLLREDDELRETIKKYEVTCQQYQSIKKELKKMAVIHSELEREEVLNLEKHADIQNEIAGLERLIQEHQARSRELMHNAELRDTSLSELKTIKNLQQNLKSLSSPTSNQQQRSNHNTQLTRAESVIVNALKTATPDNKNLFEQLQKLVEIHQQQFDESIAMQWLPVLDDYKSEFINLSQQIADTQMSSDMPEQKIRQLKSIGTTLEQLILKMQPYFEDYELAERKPLKPYNTMFQDAQTLKDEQLKAIISGIEAEIAQGQRKAIVSAFKQNSEAYLLQRSQRFFLKDAILPQDGNRRVQFIKAMQSQLEHYVTTGEIKYIIDDWSRHAKMYPGFNMSQLMHRLCVELLNETRGQRVLDHSLVNASNQWMHDHLPQLHARMQALQRHIEQLATYGQLLASSNIPKGATILALAKNLEGEYQQFLICCNGQFPNTQQLTQFQQRFCMLLHTEDIALSEDRNPILHAIFNAFIAIISLCTVPIVKLLHSKINEGRATLFFSQTKSMGLIQELDYEVERIGILDIK